MAISITRPLAPTSTTTNATSYATASYTPAANSLLVVIVFATATLSVGSLSGLGLTWNKYISGTFSGSTIYVYWAKVDGSPATGAITFNCSDDSATGCFIASHEVSGHDHVTRIPIKQSVFNVATSTNATGTFSQNLDTNNGYIAGFAGALTSGVSTVPTGWTQSSDGAISNPTANFFTGRRSTGETGATITFTNPSTQFGFIGIEIYADGLGPRPSLGALGAG